MNDDIQDYPWLVTIYNRILSSYQQNRGHHALLLISKWNNGEDILVNAIARWLICSDPHDLRGCRVCSNCQLMNAGNHPDYYQFGIDDNYQAIGVDAIRICIDTIYKHTYYSDVKIIFIKSAECLTDQAANVLTKVLEEPPKNTYFFLKTQDCMSVLPTLVSRCVRWNVMPPCESFGLKWLMIQHKKQNKERINDVLLIQCALRLCYGSPIEAQFILKPDIWSQRLALYRAINYAVLNRDFLTILPFLNSKINNNNNISIYWLIILLLDILKWKHGVEKFIANLDQVKWISEISNYWDILSLTNQLQQWLILIRYFQKFPYINRSMLLIYRLLNWQCNIVESCLN